MLASCDNPGLVEKGRKIGQEYSHGQIVKYECTSPGYSLVGTPELTCNDGSWDSKRPECKSKYSLDFRSLLYVHQTIFVSR